MTADILQVLALVADALDALGVQYCVAGSLASSAHGVARATLDVDMVAALERNRVEPFIRALGEAFYVDEDGVKDAVLHRGSFNLVHLETLLKVDVFVLKDDEYELESFRRRTSETLEEGSARAFPIERPEDNILHKLLWYKKGGCVSDRQWQDVQGVLRVQATGLDMAYLRRWAAPLGLGPLLAKALDDAGMAFGP